MDVSKSSDSLLEEENLLTPKTPVRITFRRFSIEVSQGGSCPWVSVPFSKKIIATHKVDNRYTQMSVRLWNFKDGGS